MDDTQVALNKAKIQLMSRPDSAFFTTILFSLKFSWDTTIRTACTNGLALRISPQFFMSLDPEERVFLLIHEACHVAYQHMQRLQERDPDRFNVAADHVINLMLIKRGFKMPSMGLADPRYHDMSTEEVYNLLPKQESKDVDRDIQPSDLPPDELQEALQDILVRASIQSKMQNDTIGTIPGEIQIFLDSLLNPKLPWNRILSKYLQNMVKEDYSFSRPNRRFFPKHHLPSMHSEGLMDIAVAVDTSGSVSDLEFKQFISEVHFVLKQMKPQKISLVQFDTELKSVTEVRNISELSKVTFSGRGGTRITPVMEWANIHKPQLILIFTDGGFRFYDTSTTKVPVIWVIHNNPNWDAPFGKVIHYSI